MSLYIKNVKKRTKFNHSQLIIYDLHRLLFLDKKQQLQDKIAYYARQAFPTNL